MRTVSTGLIQTPAAADGFRRAATAFAALLLLGTASAAAQEDAAPAPADPARLAAFTATVVEEIIAPRFVALEAAAANLAEDADAFCAAPSQDLFDAVGADFEATALAWAAVMTMPIDPLNREFRRERFLFWPDPRGVTLRQVQPVLIDMDPTAIDIETLREKSVALQGLGALEFVLYGGGAESLFAGGEEGGFRCAYAMTIAENLHGIAAELAEETGPDGYFTEAILEPGADNPLYADPEATVIDIVITAEEAIGLGRESLLLPALGTEAALARPRITPFWRAGFTFAFLDALVQSAAEIAAPDLLAPVLPEDALWVLDSIYFELNQIAGAMPAPDASVEPIGTDEAFRERLFQIAANADNLKGLIGLSVPRALNLSAAFFAKEGGG